MTIFLTRNIDHNDPITKWATKNNHLLIAKSLLTFTAIPFTEIPKADWLFFYSQKGVEFFFKQIGDQIIDDFKLAAMGPATAKMLKSKIDRTLDFVGSGKPKETARKFLEKSKGASTCFVQAKESRRSIQKILKGKIDDQNLIVYDNQIDNSIEAPKADTYVITSPFNAQAIFQKKKMDQKTIIALGTTTKKAILKYSPKAQVNLPKFPNFESLLKLLQEKF